METAIYTSRVGGDVVLTVGERVLILRPSQLRAVIEVLKAEAE